MKHWIEDLCELLEDGQHCTLVTIAGVRGSAPREVGAKMIVTAGHTVGSIGGGTLEHECTRLAAAQLGRQEQHIIKRKFPLGASFGQCCGGVVEVLFETLEAGIARWPGKLLQLYRERTPVLMVSGVEGVKQLLTDDDCHVFDDAGGHTATIVQLARAASSARRPAVNLAATVAGDLLLEPVAGTGFDIAIFGAGHVGTACVASLSQVACEIRWIDSRRGVFPDVVPGNVSCIESAHPALEVAALPAGSFYLVMTHSHPLDFEICGRILQRCDFAYCGLIGSRSKRRRFEKLLREQGMRQSLYCRLTCPIGVAGITGRKPAEIALAAAAQLLQIRDAAAATQTSGANVHILKK